MVTRVEQASETDFVTPAELYNDEQMFELPSPLSHGAFQPLNVQHRLLREVWYRLSPPPSLEALLAPYSVSRDYRPSSVSPIILPDGVVLAAKFSAILRLVTGHKGEPDYNRVLRYLFALLADYRPFADMTDGCLGPEYECPVERWWKRRLEHEANTDGDFTAYIVQAGRAHAGQSSRYARAIARENGHWVGMASTDPPQVLIMNPGHLHEGGDLAMLCTGSERAPIAGSPFTDTPCFYQGMKGVQYYFLGSEAYDPGFGAAEVYLP